MVNILSRFWLLTFEHTNPELWYNASDVIFDTHGVVDEKTKFAYLLQYLDGYIQFAAEIIKTVT